MKEKLRQYRVANSIPIPDRWRCFFTPNLLRFKAFLSFGQAFIKLGGLTGVAVFWHNRLGLSFDCIYKNRKWRCELLDRQCGYGFGAAHQL